MRECRFEGKGDSWRVIGSALALALSATPVLAQSTDGRWFADRGDGTYANPVLAGDYSDPDVVRVGNDFYLTASSFANAPGLPILHSRDLVNWTLIGHALAAVPPEAHFRTPRRGGGVWAPAIRHRNGRFLIYYPDPDFGIFVVTAKDPRGPWSKPELVDATKGAIDPAPFWDEDGTGWLVHAFAGSRAGKSNLIVLKRLNAAGTGTVGEARVIIDGAALPPVATSLGPRPWQTTEGPKLYRRDGYYYYLFAPSGSVKGGWQGVFRSRRIEGPYERRNVLDQGGTEINGPHQGAWVTTPAGEDWFLHFQDQDSYGRVVHLQPMRWREGWPVIGADPDGDGRGEPVLRHRKPVPGQPRSAPAADDEFGGPLSLAWQWNSNSGEDWMTLAEGRLRLKSVSGSANLYEAGNLLAQKLPAPAFTATTLLRFQPLRVGERAGLAMLGQHYAWIGVERSSGGTRILQGWRDGVAPGAGEQRSTGPVVADGAPLWLRLQAEPVTVQVGPPSFTPYWPSMLREEHAKVRFSYSLDGERFVPLGPAFESRPGRWVGAQIGLFAQAQDGTPASVATSVGFADFDWFRITR